MGPVVLLGVLSLCIRTATLCATDGFSDDVGVYELPRPPAALLPYVEVRELLIPPDAAKALVLCPILYLFRWGVVYDYVCGPSPEVCAVLCSLYGVVVGSRSES